MPIPVTEQGSKIIPGTYSPNVVFAVEWTHCIYESSYATLTLHTTKSDAVKAMVATANRRWLEARDRQLRLGGWNRPRPSPLEYEAWRVRSILVTSQAGSV